MQKQPILAGNFNKISKTVDLLDNAKMKNEAFGEIKSLANYFLKKEQLATLDSFLECVGDENKRRLVGEKEFLENYLKLALKNGRFENVINILKGAENAREPVFLSLWDEAHYMWEQALFDTPHTPLTPIQKFRVRKRNPPPVSICPDGTRPQTRMTVDDKDPLKAWLLRHRDKPYPTRSQKAQLSEETGLTVQQVATWFGNARRRLGTRRKQKQAEQGLKLAEEIGCPESLEEHAAEVLQEMKAVSEKLGAKRRKGWTVGIRSKVADQRPHTVPAEYSPPCHVSDCNDSCTTLESLKQLCLRVSRETVSPKDAAITIVKYMDNDTKNTSDMLEYNEDENLKLDEVYLGLDLRKGSDDVTKNKLDDVYMGANARRGIDETSEVSEGFAGAVQVQFVEVEVETSAEGLALVGAPAWENLWAVNELYDTEDKVLTNIEATEPSFENRKLDYADRESSGFVTISAPRQTVTSVRQASIKETAQFVNQTSVPIPVSMFENQAATVEEATSLTSNQTHEVISDMSAYQTQVPVEIFQNEIPAVETEQIQHQPSVTEKTAVFTLYSVDSSCANPMSVNPSTFTKPPSMFKHQEDIADPTTVNANLEAITEPMIDLTQPTQSLIHETAVVDSAYVFENNSDNTEGVIDLTIRTPPLRNQTQVAELESAFQNESTITEAVIESEYTTMVSESSVTVYEDKTVVSDSPADFGNQIIVTDSPVDFGNQTIVTDSPVDFGNQTIVTDSPAEFGNQTTVTEPMEVAWGNQSARAVSRAICEHHARFGQPARVLEQQQGISAVTAEIPACSFNTVGASNAVGREIWEAVTALGNLSAAKDTVREDVHPLNAGLAASGHPDDSVMRLEHHGSDDSWKGTFQGMDYGTILGEAIQGLLTLSTPHGAHANVEAVWNPRAVSNMQY